MAYLVSTYVAIPSGARLLCSFRERFPTEDAAMRCARSWCFGTPEHSATILTPAGGSITVGWACDGYAESRVAEDVLQDALGL